ncbi:hypothetical protein FHR56_004033 [Xanthomonas sacchari]|uniref:hypothetical protein n=1 Tax=unclassified Xanthomonas TaxID=2643310 RepID=UPI001368E376|nr:MULTISPECIES: hypothetical protein [unclassified Xanthomonas]MBB6368852.1 hypothetical protein [Xanthomonas sp. F10]MXV32965.1 hypothetical protein [Xanthomonas sp. LMG 8989]
MPTDPQDPQRDLADTLHGAAAYNDRGHAWLGHDAGQIADMQHRFQAQLTALAARLGETRLGPALSAAIASGAAARDDSGRYVALCEQVFGVHPSR